ncbi:hypothetical protein [Spirosoma arcticum]
MPYSRRSTAPIESTQQEISAIGKLLLCAWSAEYALRVTPTVQDAEFCKNSLEWTFPQAYYAAFFSARAVLASDGINIANQKGVNLLMNQRAGAGFYGPSIATESNPYSALMVYQLGVNVPTVCVSSLEAVALNRKLVDSVHAIAIIHETYILHRIGEIAYQKLIAEAPAYLIDKFVGARSTLITNDK